MYHGLNGEKEKKKKLSFSIIHSFMHGYAVSHCHQSRIYHACYCFLVIFHVFLQVKVMLLQLITCKLISSFLLWLLVPAFILDGIVYAVNISATRDFE